MLQIMFTIPTINERSLFLSLQVWITVGAKLRCLTAYITLSIVGSCTTPNWGAVYKAKYLATLCPLSRYTFPPPLQLVHRQPFLLQPLKCFRKSLFKCNQRCVLEVTLCCGDIKPSVNDEHLHLVTESKDEQVPVEWGIKSTASCNEPVTNIPQHYSRIAKHMQAHPSR